MCGLFSSFHWPHCLQPVTVVFFVLPDSLRSTITQDPIELSLSTIDHGDDGSGGNDDDDDDC